MYLLIITIGNEIAFRQLQLACWSVVNLQYVAGTEYTEVIRHNHRVGNCWM